MRLKLTLLCGGVLAALSFSEPAHSGWQCPVGVPDPTSGQPNNSGIACYWAEPEKPSYDTPSEPTPRPSGFTMPPPPDPAVLRRIDELERKRFEAKYGKILFYDSKVGAWLMTSAGDGTGKKCVVSFVAMGASNIVSFFGPHQNLNGAILFRATGMPDTREVKEIQPTLTFKGANPVPIHAALIPYGETSGILLPTDMVGMMRQANAEHEVTLQLDNKEVFRASMTGFLTARSAMLKCMRAES